jgi:orotidine-5'-phosphate decarboxylase
MGAENKRKPPHVGDQLVEAIDTTGSIACVGLDPRPELIPPELRDRMLAKHGPTFAAVGEAFTEFNRRIIDEVAGRCAAVKPQVACYEPYGVPGWEALELTIAHARAAGLVVIADAKRNDIGSTATHYGQAFFGGAPGLDERRLPGLGAGWLTVNGYLGFDGIGPILDEGGGVFVLVRTSNPGAGDLQDLPLAVSGEGAVDQHDAAALTIAGQMATLVARWGAERVGASGFSDVGAVVGATNAEQAAALREQMPNTLFLVPGYGAQGGGASGALAGARADGSGVVVNSSRGIIGAWRHDTSGTDISGNDTSGTGVDYAAAAGAALDEMNRDLAAG